MLVWPTFPRLMLVLTRLVWAVAQHKQANTTTADSHILLSSQFFIVAQAGSLPASDTLNTCNPFGVEDGRIRGLAIAVSLKFGSFCLFISIFYVRTCAVLSDYNGKGVQRAFILQVRQFA